VALLSSTGEQTKGRPFYPLFLSRSFFQKRKSSALGVLFSFLFFSFRPPYRYYSFVNSLVRRQKGLSSPSFLFFFHPQRERGVLPFLFFFQLFLACIGEVFSELKTLPFTWAKCQLLRSFFALSFSVAVFSSRKLMCEELKAFFAKNKLFSSFFLYTWIHLLF